MKILIISQVFWPDNASVSQHLTDLAEELAKRGDEIHVLSSRKNYENPTILYKWEEVYKGITIDRIWQTGFGKSTRIGRLIDFTCFNLILFCKLMFLQKGKYSVIIGLTSPPLVSFFGVITAKLKDSRFYYWTMDLQPELAIVSGYLKKDSLSAKMLLLLGNYIFKNADVIFTLDHYMADYIVKRGAAKEKIYINPVWPIMDQIYDGPMTENPFRIRHNLNDKIVVMYSGNHSVMHPLDTLLEAILLLKDDLRFIFVFVGGGVRKKDVTAMKLENNLENILQLPYQERNQIHYSLGAADIHVVIHGNGCTGFTHPNKIYGAMFIGRPIMYIGPEPSHITDILADCPGNISVKHSNAEKLVDELLLFVDKNDEEKKNIGQNNREYAIKNFNRSKLIDNLISEIK
jgi:colanic acid biosynthesis glycosyl transferase WcaI